MQAVHPIGYLRLQGQKAYNRYRLVRIIRYTAVPLLLVGAILFCTFISVETEEDPSWNFTTLAAAPATMQATAVTAYYTTAPKEAPTTPEQNAASSAEWMVTGTGDIRLDRALSIYNYLTTQFQSRKASVVDGYTGSAFKLCGPGVMDFTDVDMRVWAAGWLATISYETESVVNGDDLLYSLDVIENWHIRDVPAKWNACSYEKKEEILLTDYKGVGYGWFAANCYPSRPWGNNSQFNGNWGYGMGSWTGPGRIAYAYWAKETGRDFRSLETMLDYHLFECFMERYDCGSVASTYDIRRTKQVVEVLRGRDFTLENAKVATQLLFTYRMYYGSFPGANKWMSMSDRNAALTKSNWLGTGMTMWEALNIFEQQGVSAFVKS